MSDEEILWEYVEQESDDLLLKVLENVDNDGFSRLQPGECPDEMLAVKVLSAAMVKTLQIICERSGGPNLAVAFMQLSPMHAELVKILLVREMKLHGT